MIAYLKGTIISNTGSEIVLSVNGVGYAVNYMSSKLSGEDLDIHIHTVYREADVSLWGFSSFDEVGIFKALMSVSGVGPRIAFGLINLVGANELISAISRGDHTALRIPGVGEKIAKKLILDLQSKFDGKSISTLETAKKPVSGNSQIHKQAVQALTALGYKESEATIMLQNVANIDEMDISQIIKTALQYR